MTMVRLSRHKKLILCPGTLHFGRMAYDPQQKLYYFNVPQYTEDQIAKLRADFAAADKDRNGRLDKKELKKIFGKDKGKSKGLKAAFAVFDRDNSGTLSFEEYAEYLGFAQLAQTDPRSYFTRLFTAFDVNRNGTLPGPQLDQLLKAAGIEKKEASRITSAAKPKLPIGLQDLFALMRI